MTLLWEMRIAGFLLALAALVWGYSYVGDRAVAHYKQEQAIVQAKADKAQQLKYDTLSADYEVAKANKEVVFKTIVKRVDKIVEKPVYLSTCADQDGVDAANAALEGKL